MKSLDDMTSKNWFNGFFQCPVIEEVQENIESNCIEDSLRKKRIQELQSENEDLREEIDSMKRVNQGLYEMIRKSSKENTEPLNNNALHIAQSKNAILEETIKRQKKTFHELCA